MKYTFTYLAIAFSLTMAACSGDVKMEKKTSTTDTEEFPSETTKQERIKKGEYLVTIMGCNDCHTPKIMTDMGPALDTNRLLSGHNGAAPLPPFDTAFSRQGPWVVFSSGVTAFAGPWGMSFAANLTPDATGIGNWTLDNFKTAIKKGKYKGIEASRPLLPPMPWQNLTNITDEDAEAIFDYLKSVKPVENRVPAPILAQR